MSSTLGITPIVSVTMADPVSPTKSGSAASVIADRLAKLDMEKGSSAMPGALPQTSSPTSMSRVPSNPILSPLSTTTPSTGGQPSPFGSLGGVKDDGTNIGGAAARKASVHERKKSFTGSESRGSMSGSRRPSRRGSGVIMTPSGLQAVFHTRTNVSSTNITSGDGEMTDDA